MENQQLIADAEAEQLAKRLGMTPNPWKGAGARLTAAQAAQRAKEQRDERDAAERAQGQRAAAFMAAIASRVALYNDLHAADLRASALEQEFNAPAMCAAGQTYDEFQEWRRSNTYARDAELVFRSLGTYPQHHFLANVQPERITMMRAYADLLKRRQHEEHARGAIQDSLTDLETQWPALRSLPVDQAKAAA